MTRAAAAPPLAPAAVSAGSWQARLIDRFAARLEASDVVFGHGANNAADEAFRLVTDAADLGARRLERLLARRIEERVPVPYLTGVAWFAGMPFASRPGVMIPRSPIGEVLAQGARPWLAAPPRRVLDLCCGGGALGIVAARVFPTAGVDLVDADADALALARHNARRFGPRIAARVRVVASDLFTALGERRYDLVLCNPPYVPTAELDAAPPEFQHEPRRGLWGGPDGLAVWRRVVEDHADHLTASGVLVGEAGNVSRAFDERFPQLRAIWLDLPNAEPQADGGFGVFVSGGDFGRPVT